VWNSEFLYYFIHISAISHHLIQLIFQHRSHLCIGFIALLPLLVFLKSSEWNSEFIRYLQISAAIFFHHLIQLLFQFKSHLLVFILQILWKMITVGIRRYVKLFHSFCLSFLWVLFMILQLVLLEQINFFLGKPLLFDYLLIWWSLLHLSLLFFLHFLFFIH